MPGKIPDWIKPKDFDRKAYEKTLETIERHGLNTVCIGADCPNRYECFSHGTATFMILGSVCTRGCRYCDVKHGLPEPIDDDEPERIADAVKTLGIKHAVITCVTRDDLQDGGASQFVAVTNALHKIKCTVELLVSDLDGNASALKSIVSARPDVLGHNVETVPRLFRTLKQKGSYERSVKLLRKAKAIDKSVKTKSGMMVGLGESMDEIFATLSDLKKAGCDFVTVGQYLQPSSSGMHVKKYYTADDFRRIKDETRELGFKCAEVGPLVRSSYHAHA